jgi:uridylate kinase
MMSQAKSAFSRILVKLSGEALMGGGDYGIDPAVIKRIAGELQDIRDMGVQVAVVIGGGNIFRGAGLARAGMDRVAADHMGMLATVMNALAMQDALEALGVQTRVMSAIRINEVCEDYIRRRAVRAIEINADVLLKATKVNGVYSDDPVRNPKAQHYPRLTFDKVLNDKLNVMDATAIVMCRDNHLPLRVFNLNNSGDLTRIVRGEDVGTLVTLE